jgi:hypothetical protein
MQEIEEWRKGGATAKRHDAMAQIGTTNRRRRSSGLIAEAGWPTHRRALV